MMTTFKWGTLMEYLHQLHPNFQQNNISPLQPLNIRTLIPKKRGEILRQIFKELFNLPK
jgi:hypothetical protein